MEENVAIGDFFISLHDSRKARFVTSEVRPSLGRTLVNSRHPFRTADSWGTSNAVELEGREMVENIIHHSQDMYDPIQISFAVGSTETEHREITSNNVLSNRFPNSVVYVL